MYRLARDTPGFEARRPAHRGQVCPIGVPFYASPRFESGHPVPERNIHRQERISKLKESEEVELGLYEQLLNLTSETKRDGSLAELVEIEFKKRFKQDGRPKEYYYLTDLCNPAQTYWREKKPDVDRSVEVANKLAKGNRLQRIAFAWMRKIPDYVCEETHLFGEYQGIERVSGKYDMRLGDSIIEFKTKPESVPDEETVFEKYPQDLEQLIFYAALSPREAKTHYLVFQLDHQPYGLFVFRAEIRDLGMIRNILRQRVDNLDKALQNSDPAKLGMCRYYEPGCDFEKAKVCNCSTLEKLSVKSIRRAISLTIDEEKKVELESFMLKEGKSSGELLHPWNLLVPRRHFLNNLQGTVSDDDRDDSKESSMEALRKAVYRAKKLKPDASELAEARAKCLDLPIMKTWRWIAIHGTWTGEKRKRVVPALLRVNQSSKPSLGLNDIYKAQLNIARIVSRTAQGVVIVAYPNAGDKIQAYTLSSEPSDLRGGERLLRDSISLLNKALGDSEIGLLDLCPPYLRMKCSSCPDYCVGLAQTESRA